jgi:deazaflavin-dependent oxidoreductase (nitroreductase family)
MLYGKEHVKAYRETGGQTGHEWQPGVFTLLLTTTGRRSNEQYTTPLIYDEDGSDYVVASKGGEDEHPDWYLNLQEHPEVRIQVVDRVIDAEARTASADETARLWPMMAEIWPDYDNYAQKTERDIPVVVLTPRS